VNASQPKYCRRVGLWEIGKRSRSPRR